MIDEKPTEVWYLALCVNCEPLLTMPFRERAERDEWVRAHVSGAQHIVGSRTEIR